MNQTYVEDMVAQLRMHQTNFSTLVSARRLEATAYLLQAALLLRNGDIVETGFCRVYQLNYCSYPIISQVYIWVAHQSLS